MTSPVAVVLVSAGIVLGIAAAATLDWLRAYRNERDAIRLALSWLKLPPPGRFESNARARKRAAVRIVFVLGGDVTGQTKRGTDGYGLN